MPVERVERIKLPAGAGADAVGVRIVSAWGTLLVFSECRAAVEVDGVRFQGAFGAIQRADAPGRRQWLVACGARTLAADGFGFDGATAEWSGRIVNQTSQALTADAEMPAHFAGPATAGVTSYVRVRTRDGLITGFPVRETRGREIRVDRFPLPAATEFTLESVRFIDPTRERGDP
jgi:hypothetical protein